MASKIYMLQRNDRIVVRSATFDDLPKMASTAFRGYADSPLERFLSPLSAQYPGDALRSWNHRMIFRWLDPRMISVVACPASALDNVVGYAQFSRLGHDEGAKRQIASKKTVWQPVFNWYYTIKFRIMDYLWPDRSADPIAEKKFEAWAQIGDDTHWNSFPERRNRWHLRSIVVSPECRGRGIGTLLIKEVLDRARTEGVIVGLEASADGEHLYRKVGFELVSRYSYIEEISIGSLDEGGIMMWRPDKTKDSWIVTSSL